MATEKMVYVKSNDYWGYDASEFDNDANFYTYTWTVPESMYNAMDADNQAKLFPCALFYVQGVTDNHNFLTLSIDVDGANAKVRGMQGAKRRTLKFESGVPYAYSVGSLTMKAAPAGSDSVATIESEVLSGVAATDGTFNVSSFLTDASDIASAVGLATASAAESYASETEVSDFYPQSSAEIGSEQSGRGVPVAYGSGSSQYVEPPVVELSAEVSDFYPQSSAEIGDEQSGRGVPVSYGSGSSQYVEPPVVELSAEVSDFYPQSSAEVGDEQSGRGVPVSYGSGSSQYVEPPVLELGAEVIDDNYMDVYSAQGYNDKMDESLGMRDGAARKFRQSMKDRRNEAGAMDRKYGMRRKYEDVETMDAESKLECDFCGESKHKKIKNKIGQTFHYCTNDECGDEDGAEGKWVMDNGMHYNGYVVGINDPESAYLLNNCPHCGVSFSVSDSQNFGECDGCYNSFDADMIYEGLPVIPDSYGTNSALSSGQGVPQWYGSAEGQGQLRFTTGCSRTSFGDQKMLQNYEVEYSVDSGNKSWTTFGPEYRHAFKKLIEKDIKKELDGDFSHDLELALTDNKTFKVGNYIDYLGPNGEEATIEYDATFMPNEIISETVDGGETFYEGKMHFESQGTAGETNPMEFVELGAYDVPVIPNTVGTDSAGGSGYGVPQWYGADTFGADRISTSLEESAPPKMGKKVGVVALIGLGLGAWMASRKN